MSPIYHRPDLAHDMAKQLLSRYSRDPSRNGILVKILAEIGELKRALSLANDMAGSGRAEMGYLAAGNACRMHGKYKKAEDYI